MTDQLYAVSCVTSQDYTVCT